MTKKKKYDDKALRVVELFAGVGGFRLGLENVFSSKKETLYKTVWANQWEPSTKVQHAAKIYMDKFGEKGFSNEDISTVLTKDIPEHDILVGGFPCQDYSVARVLSHASGIVGKKGVLWWEIYRILTEKKKKPKYLLLENVDRLLKSPVNQRGRDFAIMLSCLNELGYAVEWRVINAADYGMPQRRRRIFFMGYHKSSKRYKQMLKSKSFSEWIYEKGIIAKAFPVEKVKECFSDGFKINDDPRKVSKNFNKDNPGTSPFENTGVMIKGKVLTVKTYPSYKGKRTLLKDILQDEKDIQDEFYLSADDLPRWEYLKGAKKEERKSSSGHVYSYNEGSMIFPDSLDKPSRTIVTGEGGKNPSRFKHVIKTKKGKLRRLTPVELERLNMFPSNHTEGEGDVKRAFFMGNALVVGVIEKLGKSLVENTKE